MTLDFFLEDQASCTIFVGSGLKDIFTVVPICLYFQDLCLDLQWFH